MLQDVAEVTCPYCGESISLLVDASVSEQEYIEDCSVCCRPICVMARIDGDHTQVEVRREDE